MDEGGVRKSRLKKNVLFVGKCFNSAFCNMCWNGPYFAHADVCNTSRYDDCDSFHQCGIAIPNELQTGVCSICK